MQFQSHLATANRVPLTWTRLAVLFLAFAAVNSTPRLSSTHPTFGKTAGAQEPRHMHTNLLIHETSPYLLQHAHNPVDWHPWGKEAFDKAKREDKPVFLSVGYSTCYWCHVMEVESFEDPEVAAVINQHFIAVKVDREERPDIDEQYMLATQMMTGRGGWPNSVWLTPDGKPWMAGTYFPKSTFITALKQINQFWVNRRDDVDRQAESLANAAKRAGNAADVKSVPLSMDLVQQASDALVAQFDSKHGGFGGAPKFPPHGTLTLLIHQARTLGDRSLLTPISATLDAMWRGGIHDHLGGGFHRYATDTHWLLPHFEKMLYDNAQLMWVYADGYQITGDPQYRAAVADIYRWVEREMTSPEGAFYSALDSGEVGKEGEAYVWSLEKLREVVGDEDSALYSEIYNFRAEGNFEEESTGQATGENIPHLKASLKSIAQQHPLGSDVVIQRLRTIEQKLLSDRLTWPQPHKDDKILTSWNGLMIGSLAHAGRVLQEPRYVEAAGNAANFILKSMVVDGQLQRTFRAGTAKLPGYLDDYVYFSKALVELHLATEDPRWRDEATRLVDIMIDRFQDDQGGGFFFTGDTHEALLVRAKNLGGGGNMPNVNGVAAELLIELAELTGRASYRESAKATLQAFSGLMAAQPHTTEDLLVAVSRYVATDPSAGQRGLENDGERVGPVTIRAVASKQRVAPGESLVVTVSLAIDEGWHLYAENPDAEFLIPTTVSITCDGPMKTGDVDTPQAETRQDPILKTKLNTYVGNLQFKVPVTLGDSIKDGPVSLKVTVDLQACDQSRCLKPESFTIELELDVVSGR